MTSPWEEKEAQALRLLADRATFGLSASERRELAEVLSTVAWIPADSMDLTAAAAGLAFVAPHLEPLPASLRGKIRWHGRRTVSGIARAAGEQRAAD